MKAYHNKDDSTGVKPCPQFILGAFFLQLFHFLAKVHKKRLAR